MYNLITSSPKLSYLNIGSCAMSRAGLNEILPAVISSQTLLFFEAKSIWPQDKAAAAIAAGQQHVALFKRVRATLNANVKRVYGDNVTYYEFMAEEKRWLVNDKTDVRKIDSVYRNRDAGLARRGLMKLNKWWDEDDDTLDEVMKGAVGQRSRARSGQSARSGKYRSRHDRRSQGSAG